MNTFIYENEIILKLEKEGFITPDEKVKELIKELTEIKNLFTLKLLFENFENNFSPQILINSLKALSDPTSFDYYSKESIIKLELHLRTLVAVLERICFSPIILSKDLRDKVYNSLTKFVEIHRKTTQIIEIGVDNNFRSSFNQFNQQKDNDDKNIINKRNYNIDFLLIHLRDTIHSLRDDETWIQEILRRTKDILKAFLNISPGVLSIVAPGITIPNDSSIVQMLAQLRQGLSFKHPVASYYIDWRIMLIIQHNIFNWSESKENIISKKFGEMILMEYLWSYLEREWINNIDKTMLDSQTKFDEVSIKLNKALINTGNFFNDIINGNEPLALPDTLWFGILDLAQNLIQRSTHTTTYGLCYYLAIESLNMAPSSFIQFKAIEILLYLNNINSELFSIIEVDFNQYSQKLDKNDSLIKFQNLLIFVKEKCQEDFNLLNGNIGKGKGKSLEQNIFNKEEMLTSTILDIIANEITCPISNEPTNQLCILKCQHVISLNNLKKLKQKKCPKCREKIENKDIRYLPQNSIYKNLYSYLYNAGYILPSIEFEDNNNNQYENDSNNSEVDLMLTKNKKFIKEINFNSNRLTLIQSMFQITKSKNLTYQKVIKELEEKNYGKAVLICKEYLKNFPRSYNMRCILAYAYRNLDSYKLAFFYLNEAIKLKRKNPIAYCIRGEIFFIQNIYEYAIFDLNISISYKLKVNNVYILLGNSNLLEGEKHQEKNDYTLSCYDRALKNYNIALQNNPNNYLCLKNCAYIYEYQEKYLYTLEMLDKLLNIDHDDSLFLCYYGEILNNLKRYNESIIIFTKASNLDPENIHILIKQAITYYIIQKYDKALLDLEKVIQLDPLNSIAYYYKGLTHYMMENYSDAMVTFEKFMELDFNDDLANMLFYYLKDLLDNTNFENWNNEIILKINQFPNINSNKLLLLIRCKAYIRLKKYYEANINLSRLFELYNNDISFIYLLQEYPDFWSYSCNYHEIDRSESAKFGIVDEFNNYLYYGKKKFKLKIFQKI
jgi:tetratricopeptide (TPR) repeat protein